ncbi:MAG: ThuA domain-containing protein [Verrucomicrobiales bacterium]|jgi:type 1 glutamine amidotransferase|nr:ThuA domain-containing protein [Verrucomicrobiales bacterium]MDP4790337.1 ThuA domain-containing protein [Verrucomicrobiales bacterium]MDP5007087.1 ThuA domain-containing protein [Verrucomicrobiales bacterium]
MKKTLPLFIALTVSLAGWFLVQAADDKKPAPLRILLVLGGCCHDYETQQTLLKVGIESRLNATVEIEYNPDKSTGATFPIYEKDNWAEGYDVVIHDECSASVTDPVYVKRILDAHRKGVPAVNLHCAMHSYRWGNIQEPVAAGADNAGWFEMLGIQSTGHGPQSPIAITYNDPTHPLTKGLANWTTVNEELYNNIQIFPGATPLAKGLQTQMPRPKKGEAPDPNAKGKEVEAVVVWTNLYGPDKTRIFSTTIGHNNETVADDRYLDLVTRGILWTTGKMGEDGTIADGVLK